MSGSGDQNLPLLDGVEPHHGMMATTGATLTPCLANEPGDEATQQDQLGSLSVNEQPTAIIQQNEESNIFPTTVVESDIFQLRATGSLKPVALNLAAESNIVQPVATKLELESFRCAELYRMHQAGLELGNGDTLVFIDFPDNRNKRIRQLDCDNIAYRSQQLRVHSENLRATGSSKFADMLAPTYQFRIQRRKKLVNNLPEGVKYVLDLTPPSEGEDAVYQMTQLSLTPGIIGWWAAEGLHDVDPWPISGHDDVCNCQQPPLLVRNGEDRKPKSEKEQKSDDTTKTKPPTAAELLQYKSSGKDEAFETPAFRNIPDYCPIRHCNSIIRLLMIIEGKEVTFDSANRVWTLVALAGIFDCKSVIKDQVAQWIFYDNNARFIEVLPEEALRIGFSLELVQVTRCAFRILVNELAIKEAATTQPRHDPLRTTVFGRRLGNLDDELSNLVQHAARELVERISSLRDQLRSPNVFDYWGIGQWATLRRMEHVLAQESGHSCVSALKSLRRLMKALTEAITDEVDQLHPIYDAVDVDRATYVRPKDFETIVSIMANMNPVQRLLCPFAYKALGDRWVNNNIFFNRRPTVETDEGVKKKTSYLDLVFEFGKALQQAVYMNHSRAFDESWALFFPADGPRLSDLRIKYPLVDLDVMDAEIQPVVGNITQSWLRHDIEPPLNMTRHLLLTLTNAEMKFLPLWAGGCNDGTGGVFSTYLPPAEMGPDGPGPAYHTGFTVASAPSSISSSLLGDVSAMKIRGSTLAGSLDAQDSISTVYAPDHVIPDDVSIATEAFDADGLEYQEARFEVPAEHQGVGIGIDMMVESISDAESAKTITDDELTTVESMEASIVESDSDDSMVIV